MIRVRRYRVEDQPAIRQLHDRVRPPWWTDPEPPPWFADLDRITEHFDAFWVAALAGPPRTVVGMVGADPHWTDTPEPPGEPEGPVIYLARMRVDPVYQRQRIGTRLCHALVEWARRTGYAAIVTNTTTMQPAAAGLYESVGFVEYARTAISEDTDHIWYVLPLTADH